MTRRHFFAAAASALAACGCVTPARRLTSRSVPAPRWDMSHGVMFPAGRVPWEAIHAAAGRVNGEPFLGRRPGTLLFLGAHADRVGGGWSVYYRFARRFVSAVNGKPLYEKAPFAPLIEGKL